MATEQLTIDREALLTETGPIRGDIRSARIPESTSAAGVCSTASVGVDVLERAARESLRVQVAKLERELSVIVAGRFPHISPLAVDPARSGRSYWQAGPRLLSLGELELLRDRLVQRLREMQSQVAQRAESERRARELLERMRAEPGSYRFVRLPVKELGERGCGVWEVRPRLGLLGMLAGWWQLKLSSGCPLPGPRAPGARPPRCSTVRRSAAWSLVCETATQPHGRACRRAICEPSRPRGQGWEPPSCSSAILPVAGGRLRGPR